MEIHPIAIISAGIILFGLVSKRLEGTILTAPMVFTLFGLVIGGAVFGLADLDYGHGFLHGLAELTLILVLFSDAVRIDLKQLKREHNLPLRLLGIGMPLTILAGTAFALLLPMGLGMWEAALLAAILAPTDAALGQSVVSSPEVPARIRQTLNVESGLNDGIALPVVLIMASLAGAQTESAGSENWLLFGAKQVILGPIAGITIGLLGARLIDFATKKDWMNEGFKKLAILSLALLAFSGAEIIGGNGFISAFVAGGVFGNTVREQCHSVFQFAEIEGELLVLLTFLMFGAAMLPLSFEVITGTTVLYAVLSLTLIRMVPVALSLLGSGLRLPSIGFLGWFGPRGLASILFALFVLEGTDLPAADQILAVTVITVGLSILLHGVTAAPAARWYGAMVSRMGECEEISPVTELPTRKGFVGLPQKKQTTEPTSD